MKMNKYLEELGYKWEELPGNYNSKLTTDCPASDIRNQEREDGMCGYEFFSLDHSLALYIYPRLCYFRDNLMKYGTPGCFTSNTVYKYRSKIDKEGQRMWKEIVEDMCEAFRLIITKEDREGWEAIDQQRISKGLHLFAEYYHCLWY